MSSHSGRFKFTLTWADLPLEFELYDCVRSKHLYCDGQMVSSFDGRRPPMLLDSDESNEFSQVIRDDIHKFLGEETGLNKLVEEIRVCIDAVYNNTHIEHEIFVRTGSEQLAKWASAHIFKRAATNKHFNIDNVRWARTGNSHEEEIYEYRQSHSCCGFEDWELQDSSGQNWRFGYNYGH